MTRGSSLEAESMPLCSETAAGHAAILTEPKTAYCLKGWSERDDLWELSRLLSSASSGQQQCPMPSPNQQNPCFSPTLLTCSHQCKIDVNGWNIGLDTASQCRCCCCCCPQGSITETLQIEFESLGQKELQVQMNWHLNSRYYVEYHLSPAQ